MSGLHLMINAELSLFQVHDITNASATKMAIEKKKETYPMVRRVHIMHDSKTTSMRVKNSKKGNFSTSSSSTNKFCEHCVVTGHTQ